MATAATNHLKDELADSLAEFSSFDRMSVDGNDLIRAVFKEFHEGGEYAKVSADTLPPAATPCRPPPPAARHLLHPTPCSGSELINPVALLAGCPPV